jgi:hypothetical protein
VTRADPYGDGQPTLSSHHRTDARGRSVKTLHTRTLLVAGATMAALAAGMLSHLGSSTATAQSATPANPCVSSTAPGHFSHVIVIAEENHAFNQVEGPAPYETSLAQTCGLASGMYGESYPSLPNYIAMTSGISPPPSTATTAPRVAAA